MNLVNRLFAIIAAVGAISSAMPAAAQEAPDAFVKRVTLDILGAAKADKEIQPPHSKRMDELVESKMLPYLDIPRMTALAAGRFWRDATPEQKNQLSNEFRSQVIFAYSRALFQIRDSKIEFSPLHADPADTDVEVRSQVLQSRGEPVPFNYRLAKDGGGWKIYDISVLGTWLIETSKGNFASEISKGGIDSLIKTLAEKNRQRSAASR